MLVLALSQIRGQDRAIEALRRAMRGNRIAHSYLFSGPEGVGKSTTARALFAALNCTQTPDCSPCSHCNKIDSRTHPDLIVMEPAGKGHIIAVTAVRETCAKMAFAPHEGGARMIIVESAECMTAAAVNAFLKTLEEPPANTHFVLVTAAPDRMPITVRSRCQLIRFMPLARTIIQEILIKDGATPDQAARAANAGDGSVSRAKESTQDDALDRRNQLLQQVLHAVRETTFAPITEAASALAQNKEDIAATLDLVAYFYRDVAACAVGLGQEKWITQDRADEIRSEVARTQAPARHARRAQTVWQAQDALQRYANAQLTLEQMMLTLRE